MSDENIPFTATMAYALMRTHGDVGIPCDTRAEGERVIQYMINNTDTYPDYVLSGDTFIFPSGNIRLIYPRTSRRMRRAPMVPRVPSCTPERAAQILCGMNAL